MIMWSKPVPCIVAGSQIFTEVRTSSYVQVPIVNYHVAMRNYINHVTHAGTITIFPGPEQWPLL